MQTVVTSVLFNWELRLKKTRTMLLHVDHTFKAANSNLFGIKIILKYFDQNQLKKIPQLFKIVLWLRSIIVFIWFQYDGGNIDTEQ